MLKRLIAYLEDRLERKKLRQLHLGYGWAMTGYFLHKFPTSFISHQMDGGDEHSIFDQGARLALRDIYAIERRFRMDPQDEFGNIDLTAEEAKCPKH